MDVRTDAWSGSTFGTSIVRKDDNRNRGCQLSATSSLLMAVS